MSDILYHGARLHHGICEVYRGEELLDMRRDLIDHTAAGFDWGYKGRGPVQLALALCADALDNDHLAIAVHLDFHQAITSRIELSLWEMTRAEVRALVDRLQKPAFDDQDRCPGCLCSAGDDGYVDVDGHAAQCHCTCHDEIPSRVATLARAIFGPGGLAEKIRKNRRAS